MRKLDIYLFKGSEEILAWSHNVGQEALVDRLCSRYGIWSIQLFQVSPGFSRGIGEVEDASIHVRRYRRS